MSSVTSPAVPHIQTALVATAPGTLAISHDVAVPEIGEDMILVKVVAVAINPSDAKMVDYSCTVGAISGYDFSGTVAAIGSKVIKDFAIGDRVCGGAHGMNALGPENGAFAQYVRAYPDLTIKIPDSMTFEAAASFATGLSTAGLALFKSLEIPASLEKPAEDPFFVLVYGGSTATGTIAIQLLKLCGLRPITTCSPRNFALVKSYGAEEAFDYNSPTCAGEIRAYTQDTLQYAFDCITEDNTMEICYGAIGRAGGRYTAVEPFPMRHKTRKAIRDDWILALTIYGKQVKLDGVFAREAHPEDYEFGTKFFPQVERLMQAGSLRSHPLKVGTGGFEGVLEGVKIIRSKAMSGMKMVYRLP